VKIDLVIEIIDKSINAGYPKPVPGAFNDEIFKQLTTTGFLEAGRHQ